MSMPPIIPDGTDMDGGETVLARQSGVLRRFALTMVMSLFKKSLYWGDVTVGEKLALTVPVSVRSVRVAAKGLKKGASVVFCPIGSLPVGFMTGAANVPLDDWIEVQVMVPALQLGAVYSITGHVMVLQ